MILEEDKSIDDDSSFSMNQDSLEKSNNDSQPSLEQAADEPAGSEDNNGKVNLEAFDEIVLNAYKACQTGDLEAFYHALGASGDDWELFFNEHNDIVYAIATLKSAEDAAALTQNYHEQLNTFVSRMKEGYYDLSFNIPQTKPHTIDIAQAQAVFKTIYDNKDNTIALTAGLSRLEEGWKNYIADNPNTVVAISSLESEDKLSDLIAQQQEQLTKHIDSYNQQQLDELEEPDVMFDTLCRIIFAAKSSKKAMAITSILDKLSEQDNIFFQENKRLKELTALANTTELDAFIAAKTPGYIKMFVEKVLAGRPRSIDTIVAFLKQLYALHADIAARDKLIADQTGVVAGFLATEAGQKALKKVMDMRFDNDIKSYLKTLTVLADTDDLEERDPPQLVLPIVPSAVDIKILFPVLKEVWQVRDNEKAITEKLQTLAVSIQGYIATEDGKEILETILSQEQEQNVDIYLNQLEARTLMRDTEKEKLADNATRIQLLLQALKNRFVHKDDPVALKNTIRSTHPEINQFISTHSRWISPISSADDDDEMEAALAEFKASITGLSENDCSSLFAESMDLSEAMTDIMRSNWAHVVVSLEGDMEDAPKHKTTYTGQHGLPIVFEPATKETSATISFSRSGPLSSAEVIIKGESKVQVLDTENISDEDRPACVYQDLQACADMIGLIDSYGHTKVLKISAGDREAARSLWALAKVHGLDCEGYIADDEDSKWLSSRQEDIKSTFPVALIAAKQQKAAPSSAPGMGGRYGSGAASSTQEEE